MVAPAVARSKCSRSLTLPNETRVLVTDVPMFAPMIIGMAIEKGSLPLATIATIKEVVTELLCARVVAKIPVTRPKKGLLAAVIKLSIAPLPSPLIPPERAEIPIKKTIKKAMAKTTFNMTGLGRLDATRGF